MTSYRTKKKKYVKGYGFLPLLRSLSDKYEKKLLDTATKVGLDLARCASKKLVHKAAEPAEKFTGKKLVKKIAKPKPMFDMNSKHVEEIVIPLEKRQEILNDLILDKYCKLEY